MALYEVTATKLNRRTVVPPTLPYDKGLAGTVLKGFKFEAQEAPPAEVPNPGLGKWYKDGQGFYYWGGAVQMVKETVPVSPLTDDIKLTLEQVQHATGASAATAQKFLPYIIDTCSK